MRTEKDFEIFLIDAIEEYADDLKNDDGSGYSHLSIRTFEDAGIMTNNQGLVVRIRSGADVREFQVTIVRSR